MTTGKFTHTHHTHTQTYTNKQGQHNTDAHTSKRTHLLALGDVEVRIFKGYADARVEGRVKALDTVCRQE